ncbi:biotin/lipoyl-containing protein, partial [Nocardiopsis salina]|uniref:biotin/lipoyl-containing protein n=1 Tax=Nocardiopsis salina TaxID=245836 RepID=UPI000370D533
MAIQKSDPAVDGVHAFKLPDVGEGLVEAELLTWYVKPGDEITVNQMICEIETAKAVVELPSPHAGTVKELRAQEGETVEVGTVIITIDDGTGPGGAEAEAQDGGTATAAEAPAPADDGEEREKPLVGYGEKATSTQRRARRRPAPSAPAPSVPASPAPAPAQEAAPAGAAAQNGSAAPDGGPAQGRPLAKPPVRKLAKDLGVDLASVTPTG